MCGRVAATRSSASAAETVAALTREDLVQILLELPRFVLRRLGVGRLGGLVRAQGVGPRVSVQFRPRGVA